MPGGVVSQKSSYSSHLKEQEAHGSAIALPASISTCECILTTHVLLQFHFTTSYEDNFVERRNIYLLKLYLPKSPYAATLADRPLEKCWVEGSWIRDLGDDSNNFFDRETRVSEAIQCYDRFSFRSVGHELRLASRGLLIALLLVHMNKIDTCVNFDTGNWHI